MFRCFYKGGQQMRSTAITVRTIQAVLNHYPINIGGVLRTINPHDTHRSYAKILCNAGVPILAIQQNLGHKDHKVTARYIGNLDSSSRPPALFTMPHLKRAEALDL